MPTNVCKPLSPAAGGDAMKTKTYYILLALAVLFCSIETTDACSLNPTAVMTTDPDGTVFYNDKKVLLAGQNSTANCGFINQYRWRVRPVGGSYTTVYQGSSPTYIYTFPLLEGEETEKSYDVELRVRNSSGLFGYATKTVTVKKGYERFYYLTDHLGSVRVTVDERGDPVGWDDYYPFGLQMPGRSQQQYGSPLTDVKFTGHELNQEGGLGIYHAGARLYDPEIGRFMQQDPLTGMYPGWSPYVYALNNPLIYIDPDGREVRCANEEDCQRAADELNEIHNNGTNITVVEAEWEEKVPSKNPILRFLGLGGTTETVSGYKLSTGESSFDWAQHDYYSALYDVINSTEIIFNFEFVPGETNLTGWPLNETAFEIGGRLYSRKGGGSVRVSADGNSLGEPTGVVIMHELVGHGHPLGGFRANAVNEYYQRKLGYPLLKQPTESPLHGGYHKRIGWQRTGLYQK